MFTTKAAIATMRLQLKYYGIKRPPPAKPALAGQKGLIGVGAHEAEYFVHQRL